MPARTPKKRTRVDPAQIRDQVLSLFSAKAKLVGIRGVMMVELATELRMSAATLYRLFPSKEALTLACVDRWAHEKAAAEAAEPDPKVRRGGFEQFMHWVDAWADANASLSPAFTRDLQSDYPLAWQRYREIVRQRQARGAELLRPVLKPELDQRVALAILGIILTEAVRPEFADRLRISRHDAIRSAVAIWAGGAVDRRGELRSMDSTMKGKKR